MLRNEQVVIWDGVNLSTRLGVPASSRAILVPMVIKDKVAAAVYVDATEHDIARLDPSSIELLVFTTGLLIDTLAIRKKTPSPSLNDPEARQLTPTHRNVRRRHRHRPATHASPHPRAASTHAAPWPGASPPDATVAVSAAQLREMMTPQQGVHDAGDGLRRTGAHRRPPPRS